MIQEWWDGACLTPTFNTDVITRRKWAIKVVIFLAANTRHFFPLSSSVAEYLFAAVHITLLWPQSCKQNRLKQFLSPCTVQSFTISGGTCCPATSSKSCCCFASNLLFFFQNTQSKNWKHFSWLRVLSTIILLILLNVSVVFYCTNGCSCTSL